MICNLSEAALHLGYRSRSTLQRLVRGGQLEAYRVPGGPREVLLETDPPGRPSLRSAVQALTQIRYDSPLWQQPRRRPAAAPLAELSDEELGARCDEVMAGLDAVELGPHWAEISTAANAMLDCNAWGPPPWPADQWATLAVVLELAQEAAAGG
jgi:hypothetical protein